MCDLSAIITAGAQTTPNLQEGVAAKIEATPEYAAVRRRMIARLPDLAQGAAVLDIGPAMGWELGALSERYPGAEIWGVTLFEAETRGWPSFARAVVCDMHTLNVADSSMDLVYASHVLEHSVAPVLAVREMARALKPGGWLEITTPEPYGVVHLGSERAFRLADIAEHVFMPSAETLIVMLRRSGLRFDSYREYAVTVGGKLHYWNRCWRAQRPGQSEEAKA